MADLAQKAREELKQSQHALTEAKSELREARRRLERLKIKVETLSDLLEDTGPVRERAVLHEQDGDGDDDDDVVLAGVREPAPATDGPYANMTTVQVIDSVLREMGMPQRISAIVGRAMANGYGGGPGGGDPDRIFAVFSSALSRDVRGPNPRFRKVRRGVFDLAMPTIE